MASIHYTTIVLLLGSLCFVRTWATDICRKAPCPARCESWDTTIAPFAGGDAKFLTHMCYGLIDYEFYLPLNVTQDAWNSYANSFGYGYDGALSTGCREALKRNICQKLYMRCPDNIDIENYATWNLEPMYEGSLIPLPFTRPCKHTCEAVAEACAASDPYAIWSGNQDCDEISGTTGVGVYTNSTDECATTLTQLESPISIQVAENIERYVGINLTQGYLIYNDPDYDNREAFTAKLISEHENNVALGNKVQGICSDAVDNFFTAVWDPLYLSRPYFYAGLSMQGGYMFAPFLPPFGLQWATEWMVDIWHILPDMMTSVGSEPECRKAFRKFSCGSAFYQGEKQVDGFLQYVLPDFYIEQHPSQEICEDYVDQCKARSAIGISFQNLALGRGIENDASKLSTHCSDAKLGWYGVDGNMSWYPNKTEILLPMPGLGDFVRSPNRMESAKLNHWADNASLCHTVSGINRPFVKSTEEYTKSNWADNAIGMPATFIASMGLNIKDEVGKAFDNWADKICPGGWAEYNPDCPWSYEEHVQNAACLKSCFQFGNYLDQMRDPNIDKAINVVDHVLLWIVFILMSYMVATWTIFREKAKQRIVLVLSALMWLQTFVELIGYVAYPTAEKRFCENDAVPYHHGFNYCAISAMLNLGIIGPMFQLLVACMALDVYFKVVLNIKNKNHYWKYYTFGSFVVAVCFKFVPVFIMLEAAGFDGVNACGYTFYLRQPNSKSSPTPVFMINEKYDVDLSVLILMNTVEHFAWVVSVLIFSRIIAAVMSSMKRVGSSVGGEGESAVTSALKQIRLVKTPVLMIFFFTIVSAAQIYLWDVYAIVNWDYFGPGDNPMGKKWFNNSLWSPYYSWLHNRDEERVAYTEWDSLDSMTKVMNYYNKLINHLAFPTLLFVVFGTHKDNLNLWLKKMGLESFVQSETSAGGSSYDWTIVKQNQKLQKLGVKKYFGQLFKSENDNAKVHSVFESGVVSAWEGSTMSVAEKDDAAFESVQE